MIKLYNQWTYIFPCTGLLMLTEPATRGDIHGARGIDFERRALLYYFLLRWAQCPEAIATLATDEDATICYPAGPTGSVIEDIQCKKMEEPRQGSDDWWARELPVTKLVEWLSEARGGLSSVDRLSANPALFFTLLVFAEPSKPVRKFLAPGASAPALTRQPVANEPFPIDYCHPDDPDPKNRLGRTEAARKVRVVPLCPKVLQMFSEELLHTRFLVAASKTRDAYYALEHLIGFRKGGLTTSERQLQLRDVENEIAKFRMGQGAWRTLKEIVAAEDGRQLATSRPDFPVVTWADFKGGRYILADYFQSAAQALRSHGFLVVSGYTGAGKTTLCRYLSYEALQTDLVAQCFYLQVRPGDDLLSEIEFFSANLKQPFLFIIDDEQFSQDAVKAIASNYLNSQLQSAQTAKLVIASTQTYSGASQQGRIQPLDNGHHVKFELLPPEVLQTYLTAFQRYRQLDPRMPQSGIAELSNGKMGMALLLAHSLNSSEFSAAQPIAIRRIRGAMTSWLASALQLDRSDIVEHIAPVLATSSFGLPTRVDFCPHLDRLQAVGILEEVFFRGVRLYQLRPEHSIVAWIAWHYQENKIQIFNKYAEQHPAQIGQMSHVLARDETGRGILRSLLHEHIELFAPRTPDDLLVDLPVLTQLIAAAGRVGRALGSRLVKYLFGPGTTHALALRLTIDNVELGDMRQLTSFLNTFYNTDREFARRFWRTLPANSDRHFRFLALLRLQHLTLEESFQFLRAIKQYDVTFSLALVREFAHTPEYEEKWRQVESNGAGRIVGAVRELAELSRRLFIAVREQYLADDAILSWHQKVQDLAYFVSSLSQLRRVAPREASRALFALESRRPDALVGRVGTTANITESTSIISNVSLVDRRIAINLAKATFSVLAEQIRLESRFNNVASALVNIQHRTTPHFAGRLAEKIDQQECAHKMQQERKRLGLVGESLAQMSSIAPSIASSVASRLTYQELYARTTDRPLWDYVNLTAGLTRTLSAEDRLKLLNYIRTTPALARALYDALRHAPNLNGIAHAISALVAAGLSKEEIFGIFGFSEEPDEFGLFIDRFVGSTKFLDHSDDELANLLFALSQLQFGYGYAVLKNYLRQLMEREAPESLAPQTSPAGVPHQVKSPNQRQRATGRVDLSGLGALFQISAAIDDEIGKQLLHFRLPNEFNATADNNLGRHAIFILGLNNVSRKACLRFLDHVYTAEVCGALLDRTQNAREIIYFLHAIQLTSVAACRRIATELLAERRDELEDYLKSEVNLTETSHWVKTLLAVSTPTPQELAGLVGLLEECSQFDTRLFSLVEGVEAMIDAGAVDRVNIVAADLIDNLSQAKGLSKLSHCIQLWLKMQRIGRSVSKPKLLDRLEEVLLPRALDLMALENDKLCSAYAIHIWLASDHPISNTHRGQLENYRKSLLAQAKLSPQVTPRWALIAALVNAPADEMNVIQERIDLAMAPEWLIGLLAVIIEACAHGSRLALAPRLFSVDRDQNNLKFGLAYYAARKYGRSAGLAGEKTEPPDGDFMSELACRKRDESSAAVRMILDPEFDAGALKELHYYLWVYLRRTLLAPTYMNWENDIAAANEATIFNLRFSRSTNSIVEAAE